MFCCAAPVPGCSNGAAAAGQEIARNGGSAGARARVAAHGDRHAAAEASVEAGRIARISFKCNEDFAQYWRQVRQVGGWLAAIFRPIEFKLYCAR